MSDEILPDPSRNLLIYTPRTATVGALLRQRIMSGGALLRTLLPTERKLDAGSDDEAY